MEDLPKASAYGYDFFVIANEKRPLDMTTDEAIEHLFGEETAQKLREIAHGKDAPPSGDDGGLKAKSKSARKHGTT